MVSLKLVKNWQAEYVNLLNTNDRKLNFEVFIKHKTVTPDERIGTPKKKKMMTLRGIQLTTNASRYLIITLSISYKNNVLYYLCTYEINFVIVPWKKKRELHSKLIAQDIYGQIFQNKYHEKKKIETKRMSLYLSAQATHFKAKI